MGLILQMKLTKMRESSAIRAFDWFQLVCVDEYRRLSPEVLVSFSYSSSHPLIKSNLNSLVCNAQLRYDFVVIRDS